MTVGESVLFAVFLQHEPFTLMVTRSSKLKPVSKFLDYIMNTLDLIFITHFENTVFFKVFVSLESKLLKYIINVKQYSPKNIVQKMKFCIYFLIRLV